MPDTDLGRRGGRLAFHINQVFDGQGNPVQYPQILVMSEFAVCSAGTLARLVSQNGDEGIDLVVAPKDRVKALLDQVLGGQTSISDTERKLSD